MIADVKAVILFWVIKNIYIFNKKKKKKTLRARVRIRQLNEMEENTMSQMALSSDTIKYFRVAPREWSQTWKALSN